MARQPGLNNFAGTLEVLAGGPLDARTVVANVSDLTANGTFSYPYVGMIVSVESTGKAYILKDIDYTKSDSWQELGTGEAGDTGVILGYYDSYVDTFYLEKIIVVGEGVEYRYPVTPNEHSIYLDRDYHCAYFYNEEKYMLLDAVDCFTPLLTHFQLDAVVGIYPGKIVHYLGDDRDNFKSGYFYECIPEAGNPGFYTWMQRDVQPHGVPQFEVMPSKFGGYDGSQVGDIVQYVGETDSDYTNGYFYKCVESEPPGSPYWEVISVQQGGGSGSGSLQKAITAAIEVGGIDVGDEFAIGTSYDDMWDALLNPTLYPTFTNPSASLTYSADTYYEVGTNIPAKSATASLNRGSISPAYGTSGYRSGEATNYALATSGADTEYSDSSTSSGTFSVPALTRATKGNIVLTATVSYAAGEQPKDSKGNNYDSPLAAGSKTASKTMQFIQPYYYGKSATSTVSNFTGLTKSVTAKGQKQFKFTTNNEYMVIAYDSSYGNLSSIIDPNGFETISGWTKSTLTVGGFSYFVYVANSATTDTNAQFTFKY